MRSIDLHVHSTYSDGTMTPAELLKLAEEKGLAAFALTDHDATKGLDELLALSADSPVEVVPGIEITTAIPGKDIHILGYYINYHRPELQDFLSELIWKREDRNIKMCERLHEAGLSITYEALRASVTPETILTRAHFARFLVDAGDVSSMSEAFSRYLGDRCPTYVHREKVLPEEAVKIIRAVGGVPVLAHPIIYGFSDDKLESLVATLKEAGLAGIETVYSTYQAADERQIRNLAKKYDLLMTGGSDFHGSNKPHISLGTGMGKLFIPEEFLDGIKKEYMRNYLPQKHSPALLTFDLDGTLINDEKVITPDTKAALDRVRDSGHRITISTGRPFSSARKLIVKLGLDEYKPLVSCFNGGCIVDWSTGEVMLKKTLDHETAAGIRDIIRSYGRHFHTYTDTEVLTEKETEEVIFYGNYVNLTYRVVDDVLVEEPNPYKIIIMHLTDKSKLVPIQTEILEKYGDRVQCVFSGDKFLEVIPLSSGKGAALLGMCKLLGIPRENSYAFADEDNDISMLTEAAHGVALVNGSKGAKKAADYITFKDNNHDGLVSFLDCL